MNELEILKYIDGLSIKLVNANNQLTKINYYLQNKDNDREFLEIEKKICEEKIKHLEITLQNAMEFIAVYFNKGEEFAERFDKYIVRVVEIYDINNKYKEDDTTYCELRKAYKTIKNGGEE